MHVVIGPPAAGKSTFVAQAAQPGDVVLDFDLLANALAGADATNHDHTPTIKAVAKAARRAALDKAKTLDTRVWLIHSLPAASTLRRYIEEGAEIHVIDPGKEVVMSRCKAERPRDMLVAAATWYERDLAAVATPTRPRSTTEKGLGWDHQKERDALLAVHVDGTPCWWCGRPMYRERSRNFDGRALAADHSLARALGGTRADRLLHSTCNSARGDGHNDAQRPALVAASAPETPAALPVPATPAGPSASFPAADEFTPASVFDWPSL
ncbi:hypothetical protein INS45_01365 [Corynebacterium aurimucosum]|nr:hypothetical protein [Corynebacterium aurimucosum]